MNECDGTMEYAYLRAKLLIARTHDPPLKTKKTVYVFNLFVFEETSSLNIRNLMLILLINDII